MGERSCDLLVIGAGQAAEEITAKYCAKGMQVFVAERKQPGGSCVNFGCTPSKTAIASADVAAKARRAAEFGLRIPTVDVDYARVLELARKSAEESRDGATKRYGDKLIHGHARFVGKDGDRYVVEIGEDRFLADQVVINVGTRSLMPDIDGLLEIECITGENWLYETELPRRIALLGGGYISIEMCQFYRRMGVEEVTVVDTGHQILAREDPDVSDAVQKMLESEGVRFMLGTKYGEVKQTPTGILLDCGGTPLEVDKLFVAVGRRPNSDDLGLEKVGIERDEKGFIKVDKHLKTGAPNIFATGDVRGGAMFTHTAWDDARIVLSILLDRPADAPDHHSTDRIVPYAVFTDPPLGRVGMSEKEAKESGKEFEVLRFDMSHNAQADEQRDTTGFIKVLLEKETDMILGAAIFGGLGSELIHMYELLMIAKLPASKLREAVIAHPTYAEGIQNVLLR